MKMKGSVNRIVHSKTSRVLLFFFLAAFIASSLWFSQKLNQSQKQRYLSYVAADELRQSSDDLTRLVRTYVTTGDARYEQMYWDILAIRKGQKARPTRYENIYWDFMAFTHEKPRSDGHKISLIEMMKDLGFTQEELAKLAHAETDSNRLVKIEEIAMHAIKGEFQDAQGEFTIRREPDHNYARAILYDESYHKAKVDIMTPIDEVFVLVNTRTEAKVNRDTICTYISVSIVFAMLLLLLRMSRVELNERKQAEEALQASEERLRRAVVNSPFPIMIHAEDGEVVQISKAWSELTGYQAEEIPTITEWTAKAYGQGRHLIRTDIDMLYELNDKKNEGEYDISTKDGRVLTWDFSSAPLGGLSDGKRLVISMAMDVTERKQAELELLKNHAQLKSLASELVLAEERERNRIAVHLHDDVCQNLAYAKMKLQMVCETLDDQVRIADMTEVSDTLTRLMQDVRTLTFELSSPILTEFGLESAVSHWLTEQIEQKHGIATDFTDDGQAKPLEEDVQALVFRSVRELLANTVKHSQAKRIEVSISRAEDQVLVHLEDDGIGFDPDKVVIGKDTGGFGLFSIRERLSHLGGSLEIDSSPGQGCRSVLRAPLEQS
ncbi:MAG: PAS domain S-box protein [Phycisphaeraceae bacterium]|nr:PAS domain S-box protein [Phycisphaeraceae bacterium]